MSTKKLFFAYSILSIFCLTLFTACQKDEATGADIVDDHPEELSQTSTNEVTDFVAILDDLSTDESHAVSIGISPLTFHIEKGAANEAELVELIKVTERLGSPLELVVDNEGFILDAAPLDEAQIENWKATDGSFYQELIEENEGDGADSRNSKYFSSYWEVKNVFNYLKDQNCNSYYTPEVYPCITFQYKLDGCFARAHKMKTAMEDEFGKTCDKIFAYGKLNSGCGWYKRWRYHVAPVVYVGSTKYVLDPSLSNYPLSVTAWKNKMDTSSWYDICDTDILSGSYYLPKDANSCGYQGYYVGGYTWHVNQTLLNYKNKYGCSY